MVDKHTTVAGYVAAQPAPVREILDELRRRVHATVPNATEVISYDIPTFKVEGKSLIYIAAWKKHIAVYPIPHGDDALGYGATPLEIMEVIQIASVLGAHAFEFAMPALREARDAGGG